MHLLLLILTNLQIYELLNKPRNNCYGTLLNKIVDTLAIFKHRHINKTFIYFLHIMHSQSFVYSNIVIYTVRTQHHANRILSFVFMRTFHDQVPYFSASPSHLHNSVSYIYIYYVTFIKNILKPERDKIDPVSCSMQNHSQRLWTAIEWVYGSYIKSGSAAMLYLFVWERSRLWRDWAEAQARLSLHSSSLWQVTHTSKLSPLTEWYTYLSHTTSECSDKPGRHHRLVRSLAILTRKKLNTPTDDKHWKKFFFLLLILC